uniref:Uncharacterized protein n=1 Tax=Pararge aegeria TaxID=116150 RepID=S4P241_9NEOP
MYSKTRLIRLGFWSIPMFFGGALTTVPFVTKLPFQFRNSLCLTPHYESLIMRLGRKLRATRRAIKLCSE